MVNPTTRRIGVRPVRTLRAWLFLFVVLVLLGSTLFVSSAKKTSAPVIVPRELDVRVAGGVLRGGQTATDATAEGASEPDRRAASLNSSRGMDAAQAKSLGSLEKLVARR